MDDLLMSGYFLRAKKYKLQQTEKEKAEAAFRTVSPSNREVGGRIDHMLHIFQGSYFTVSVTHTQFVLKDLAGKNELMFSIFDS